MRRAHARIGLGVPLAIALLAFGGASIHAQPMADSIPADAWFYAGWQGAGPLGDRYDRSRLAALNDDWRPLRKLRETVVPQVRRTRGTRDADDLLLAIDLIDAILNHTSAAYIGPLGISADGTPQPPKLAIVIDGGRDWADIRHVMEQIAEHLEGSGLRVETHEGRIGLVSETVDPASLARLRLIEFDGEPAPALAGVGAFRATVDASLERPDAVVYVDAVGLLDMVRMIMDFELDADNIEAGMTILAATGLDKLDRIAWAGRFDGSDWLSGGFIEAHAPRTGLLSLLDREPLDDTAISAIPASAQWAHTGGMDLTRLVQTIRRIAFATGPNGARPINLQVARASALLGVDVEDQLLPTLGVRWLVFGDATTPGLMGTPGFIIMHRPRDAAALAEHLTTIARHANRLLEESPGSRMQIEQTRVGDVVIHYIPMPVATPAMAVAGDRLYVALAPQAIADRLRDENRGEGGTIAQREGFAELLARLAPGPISGLSYADLPETTPPLMQQLVMVSAVMAQVPSGVGAPDPTLFLPPLDRLMEQLTPTMAVSWADDAGYHWRSVEPFPGAASLAPSGFVSPTSAPTLAFLAGVAAPSIANAREAAQRVVVESRLRSMQVALMAYALQHGDQIPPDIGTLVAEGYVPVGALANPRLGTIAPEGAPLATQVLWAETSSDYIYRAGRVSPASAPETIVFYERPVQGLNEGISMVFADGSVLFLRYENAVPLLQAAGEPIPAWLAHLMIR